MSLFFAELRKVWGSRVFPMLLAVLAAANLLLLWMGTRPTASQPPAAAWRAVGVELSGLTMEEKGEFLHGKLTEYESLLKIDYYYRQLAYGSLYMQSYRQDNAALFEQYEQEYRDKSYRLYTDDLNTDYRLFTQLASEYDTVAAYPEFLDGVQARATQLAGISIFQNDETGYDMENIELTASVYAGLGDTPHRLLPAKGAVHRHLLRLHRPDPAGGHAAFGAAAGPAGAGQRPAGPGAQPARRPAENRAVQAGGLWGQPAGGAGAFVRRQPGLLRRVLRPGAAGPHHPKRARFDALHHADHGGAVPVPVFAGQVGRGLCHGAVGHAGGACRPPGRGGLGRRRWRCRWPCTASGRPSPPPRG